MGKALRLAAVVTTMGLAASGAMGQSISLDDGGQSPATPAPPTAWVAVPYGNGAENQFGSPVANPLVTLSPTLDILQASYPDRDQGNNFYDNPYSRDGTIFTPGLAVVFDTFAAQVDAFSTNKAGRYGSNIRLNFSVDRLGQGGGAVGVEASTNQQASDIFLSTTWFTNPGAFAGQIAAMNPTGKYSGVLSSSQAGGTNFRRLDQTQLGLISPSETPTPGSHDNIDAFDFDAPLSASQAVYERWSYFSTQPLETQSINAILAVSSAIPGSPLPPQVSAADIFAVPAGSSGMSGDQAGWAMLHDMIPIPIPLAFAQAPTLGLDAAGVNTDSVDGLILYDNGTEGVLEPGVDYALFSLAPGSAALAANSLSAGDVLFTDFSGHFGLYAKATDLGLTSGSNIDALEVPEPATLCVLLVGGAAGLLRRQRT